MTTATPRPLQLAVLFGGASAERGISINSARSLCDHLPESVCVSHLLYLSPQGEWFPIERKWLYQNTPADFDFRLAAAHNDRAPRALAELTTGADLLFPAGHGSPFEDGTLATTCEAAGLPLVGSGAAAGRRAFNKWECLTHLVDDADAKRDRVRLTSPIDLPAAREFLEELRESRAILKPARSGSSVGVRAVVSSAEVTTAAHELWEAGFGTLILEPDFKAEPYAGREFSVVIVQGPAGEPVALVPTLIDCAGMFSTRLKYLPSEQVRLRTPPPDEVSDVDLNRVREAAANAFRRLGLSDFARVDLWLLADGSVRVSDVNLISGLEQNGILFLQAAACGLTHRDLLSAVIDSACRRQGLDRVESPTLPDRANRRRVLVCFGGETSERQVSVQSGTNVWLKLERSAEFDPTPVLVEGDTAESLRFRRLDRFAALHHTVEEIRDVCERRSEIETRLRPIRDEVRGALDLPEADSHLVAPAETLDPLVSSSAEPVPLVFLALHGGVGEDGTLQQMLAERGVLHTGSPSQSAALCADKGRTADEVDARGIAGLSTTPRRVVDPRRLVARLRRGEPVWSELLSLLGARTAIIKPTSDGCSSGVARLANEAELVAYLEAVTECRSEVPAGALRYHAASPIPLPTHVPERLLVEAFVETRSLRVTEHALMWTQDSEWIEATITVVGEEGEMHALPPTVTVREADVLTLDEKFHAGQGVNLTPPPEELMSAEATRRAMQIVTELANRLRLAGLARIDVFLNCRTGEVRLIEVNTTPGMTPSTAVFHAGLANDPPLFPLELLEQVCHAAVRSRNDDADSLR